MDALAHALPAAELQVVEDEEIERMLGYLESAAANDDEPARSKNVTRQASGIVAPLPRPAWSKNVTEAGTKNVTRRHRRSEAQDRRTIDSIRLSESKPTKARCPTSVGKITPSIAPISEAEESYEALDKSLEKASAEGADLSHLPVWPAWEFTTDVLKVICANRVLAQFGRTKRITLNLGHKELKRALANPKGFTHHVKKNVSRALNKEFGYPVPLWFTVHTTPAGRQHIHGAIAHNDNEPEVDDRVEAALRHAGGKWKSHRNKKKQADCQSMFDDPDDWAFYALNRDWHRSKSLPGKIVSITHDLRAAGEQYYARLRMTHR
jgi:hypothetical protein